MNSFERNLLRVAALFFLSLLSLATSNAQVFPRITFTDPYWVQYKYNYKLDTTLYSRGTSPGRLVPSLSNLLSDQSLSPGCRPCRASPPITQQASFG